MEVLFRDVRYGLRSLLKRPGFTAVAVITLALGIGVNTAIFSVINALLLRPLSYQEPDRIVTFRSNQSSPDLADVEAQTKTFSTLGGLVAQPLDYTGGSEPIQFQVGQVTGGFFGTLGVKPERGRFIMAADDRTGAPYVVVLSHALWSKQFSSDQQILGKTIPLSGNVYTIIGVMPAAFVSPRDNTEAWTLVHVSNPVAANFRGVHFLRTYGRLAPGVIIEQARAEMQVIDKNLAAQYPADNKNRSTVLIPLAGGVIAVLLAIWGTSLLVALKPENLPRLEEIGVDARVLGFTFAISLLTGVVFGLLPAWTASRGRVNEALKEGGRSATAGGARQRLRSTFVVVELAVALILLVGAGLLIKTFWNLRSVEPGFSPDHLLTMRVELPEARYKEVDTQTRFRSQALAGINSLPGVQAAMISELPLSGDALDHDFVIDGRPPIAPGDEPSLQSRSIMGDYFHTMKIPLRKGRDFGPQDFVDKAPLVGIANDAMVRQYFQSEDPLGKRVRFVRNPQVEWITIVGVVGDVKHFGLDLPEQPGLYSPYTQANAWKRWMAVVARTQSDPAGMALAIKQQIWKVDSQLPITKVETMNEVAAGSFAARRFNMLLLAIFAALAVVLAAVGIYGVMSYAVTQRTQEIGIRMALGARASDVLKLVIRSGVTLILLGVAIGIAGAAALTRLLATFLFGVTPTDTRVFLAVSAVLIFVALLACYLPARRSTKVDPLVALRYE